MLRWTNHIDQVREQPSTGDYSDWKEIVAGYCNQRCTYCCIHVSRYGGIDNFHVDHFRPKSKFGGLRKAIKNLFLACAICNRFKSNHWPAEPVPDHSVASFPDPVLCDYNDLFMFEGVQVRGRVVATKYVVEQLYLNRPQLLRERRLAIADKRVNEVVTRVQQLIAAVDRVSETRETLQAALDCALIMIDCQKLLNAAYKSKPYESSEVRRASS